MNYVYAMLAALVCGIVSVLLLRLSEESVEQRREEQDMQPLPGNTAKKKMLCITAIFIGNLCLACRMEAAGDSLLSIINTLSLLAVLWACAWSDARAWIIPNRILILGAVLRILILAVESLTSPGDMRFILSGSVVAAIALLIVSILCRVVSPKAIGFGDVKLLTLMGFFLKVDGIWNAMLFSMLAAFLYSLYLLVFKKANRHTELPFAPILLVGTIAAIF